MVKKYYLPLAALSVLGLTNVACAARNNNDGRTTQERHRSEDRSRSEELCEPPAPPAMCYPDDCAPCERCLGPENYGANAPVGPKTCGGDWVIDIAGFYWNSHLDGMEYVIDNQVQNPGENPDLNDIQELNNLIESEYVTPHFKWDFGFKLGVGYVSPCDGWDVNLLWTWYRGKARDHVEAETDDNHTLLPLWSAFSPVQGSVLYATDAENHWSLKLNLVDLELGRQFWTSKYLSIRPFIGLRYANIKQELDIAYKGGSWSERADPAQDAYNDAIDIDNKFRGIGLKAGLNSEWNFGCGWALYGNMAAAIVYGRFNIDHDETIRLAIAPHTRTNIFDTEESFRASRGMIDLSLGVQWSTMFCDCQYGFTAMLGWEHHLFFNQNQMWRVNRIGDDTADALPNNTGENVFIQRRGDLDTQGWTLTFKFEF